MRYVFLVLMLCTQAARSQDFCGLIKKEISPDHTIYDYSSPFDPLNPPSVRVTRSYGTNPDYATDNFFMVFQVICGLETIYTQSDTGQTEKDEFKLEVFFDDQTRFVTDTVKIGHDFTNTRDSAIRYLFYPLNDKAVREFSNKKITKFGLAGFYQQVPSDSANAIAHYVQCLKAVH